jgi:hypothetical protein
MSAAEQQVSAAVEQAVKKALKPKKQIPFKVTQTAPEVKLLKEIVTSTPRAAALKAATMARQDGNAVPDQVKVSVTRETQDGRVTVESFFDVMVGSGKDSGDTSVKQSKRIKVQYRARRKDQIKNIVPRVRKAKEDVQAAQEESSEEMEQ